MRASAATDADRMPIARNSLAGLAIIAVLVLLGVVVALQWTARAPLPGEVGPGSSEARQTAELTSPAISANESARAPIDAPPDATHGGWAVSALGLELEILDAKGALVARAPVLLLDAMEDIQTAQTDETGRVRFDPRDGSCALFVRIADEAPRRGAIDATPGSRLVRLARTEELSGVVRDNGMPPSDRLDLTLLSDRALFDAHLPKAVHDFLELRDGRYRTQLTIAPDGSFAFRGLPPTWSGRLILPRTWAEIEADRGRFGAKMIPTGSPQSGLVIDVERVPHLTGRIVDELHQPVPDALVHSQVTWEDGGATASSARSGPAGRFDIELEAPAFLKVKLEVDGPGGAGSCVVERPRIQIGRDLDMGDIVLTPGATLRLHVTDADAQPIAGAVADPGPRGKTVLTDEAGNCTLTDLPADAEEVRVHALGYWSARIQLPSKGADPIHVVMRPCNRLTIQARMRDGSLPGAVRFHLSSGENPILPDFRAGMYSPLVPGRFHGAAIGSTSDGQGRITTRVATDETGRFSLEGIAPGVPILLRVMDTTGTCALERELRPLGETEDRTEEVELDRVKRTLSGEVRDIAGTPISGARVQLGASKSAYPTVESDALGKFTFEGLYATSVEVRAWKEGFAQVLLADLLLVEPVEHVVVTLERGREVTVAIVDAHSRPVSGCQLNAMDAQTRSGRPSRETGPGLYRFAEMPPREITLQLYLAGKQYEQPHDARNPEARMEVPVHGRVVVDWIAGRPGRHKIELHRVDATLDVLTSVESQMLEGKSTFAHVLPGEYEVRLVTAGSEETDATPRRPTRIVVEPDKTARADLRP